MNRTFAVTLLAIALGGAAMAQAPVASEKKAPTAGPQFPPVSAEEKARADAAEAAYQKTPDTEGTGAFPALKEEVASLPEHTVYRPKDLAKVGKAQLGIIGWGNGACSADGAGQRFELAELASHGYVVIAPGGIHSGPGSTPLPKQPATGPGFTMPTTSDDVKAGIEWALAENLRPASPYFGKIDSAKIGVAGFSCGGIHTLEMAADPRVKTIIMQNSGLFPDGSNFLGNVKVNKATLQTLRIPVLYILGGPKDVAYKNGLDDFRLINRIPIVVAVNDAGHGGDFLRPNGGPSAYVAVKWFEWQLRGDKEAGKYFSGPDCGICKDPQWKVEKKNIPDVK